MLIVIGRPKTIKTRLVSVKIDLIITILTFYSNHIICCYIYSFILEFRVLSGPKFFLGHPVPKKMHHKVLCSFCLLSPATIILESCDISQMKGDIHKYVLSTNSFLCDIGELRYSLNNTGYQIAKIVKYRLIPNS